MDKEKIIQVLKEAQNALFNSKPIMHYYPEPRERHSQALLACMNLIKELENETSADR